MIGFMANLLEIKAVQAEAGIHCLIHLILLILLNATSWNGDIIDIFFIARQIEKIRITCSLSDK